MMLAERLYGGDRSCETAWNFGPPEDDSRSVGDVAERLAALWGDGAAYTVNPDHSLHESHLLRLDSSRSIQHLRWKRKLKVEEAIVLTVEWYKQVYEDTDALSAMHKQIYEYMER
jgi:CDP-glucose 4,6-dehydratase